MATIEYKIYVRHRISGERTMIDKTNSSDHQEMINKYQSLYGPFYVVWSEISIMKDNDVAACG